MQLETEQSDVSSFLKVIYALPFRRSSAFGYIRHHSHVPVTSDRNMDLD